MITAAMIAYYIVAFGLIYCVAYFTYRQNSRRSQALVDKHIAEMGGKYGHTLSLEPYVREPLPELPPPPELRITIARHPESDRDRLPGLAAEVIRQASQLEKSFGGDGLDYDPKGSVEEAGRLVLRLVPRSSDWEAAGRLAAVAEEFNRLVSLSKQDSLTKDAADIRAKIDRELQPHLPAEVVERVGVATTC